MKWEEGPSVSPVSPDLPGAAKSSSDKIETAAEVAKVNVKENAAGSLSVSSEAKTNEMDSTTRPNQQTPNIDEKKEGWILYWCDLKSYNLTKISI